MKESFQALSGTGKVALISAAAVIVGVFLPWVSVFGLSVSGISTGDGKVVLVVAVAALVLMATASGLVEWFEVSHRLANIVSMAAATLCLVISIADLSDFAALGLYVTFIGSLAWTIAAAMTLFRRRTHKATSDTGSID